MVLARVNTEKKLIKYKIKIKGLCQTAQCQRKKPGTVQKTCTCIPSYMQNDV